MRRTRSPLQAYTAELLAIFRQARSKHHAHDRSRVVLRDMAADPACLRAVLAAEVARPGALNTRHYPAVNVLISHNAYFGLVANCFLPLPSRETDVTTNAIHHHGHLLLTSVTTFGPGYEHWRFSTPQSVDRERNLFSIALLDREIHRVGHVAFVDALIPHAVMFPSSLTVTFALWSSRYDVTWRDHLKRLSLVQVYRKRLRNAARRLGVARALRINIESYFDYYPVENGFHGMPERVQFQLGPNEDFLYTFFHILQKTGNEDLAADIGLHARVPIDNPALVERLSRDLRKGSPIAHRFSEGLHWLPHMNFKAHAIERALVAVNGGATSRHAAI